MRRLETNQDYYTDEYGQQYVLVETVVEEPAIEQPAIDIEPEPVSVEQPATEQSACSSERHNPETTNNNIGVYNIRPRRGFTVGNYFIHYDVCTLILSLVMLLLTIKCYKCYKKLK